MKTKLFTHKVRGTLVAFAAISSMLAPMGVYAAVDSTADVSTPSTESCNVSATFGSSWQVTIPKHVSLGVDTATNVAAADYEVSVLGDIEPEHCITVEPDNSFAMLHGSDSVAATVTQDVTVFRGDTLTPDAPEKSAGSISAGSLTTGDWGGHFDFHIAETGHQHSFGADGMCACGEKDPNHQHSFGANGMCACGEKDPNHQHVFGTNGMCPCGVENPDAEFVMFSKNMYNMVTVMYRGNALGHKSVHNVVFEDRSAEELGRTLAASNCRDCSFSGDGSVVGWVVVTDEGNGHADIHIAPAHSGNSLRAPDDISGLFSVSELRDSSGDRQGSYHTTTISGLANIDFSHVTNVSGMFEGCYNVAADFTGTNLKVTDNIAPSVRDCNIKLPDGSVVK